MEAEKEKGNVAFVRGRYAEALQHYTKAIKLDPKNHILYSNRSATHLLLGNAQKALEDADTGTHLNPEWPKNYYRKAEALFSLRRFSEIHEVIERGKKLDEKMFEEILERTTNQLQLERIGDLPVSARIVSKTKGKGLFAEKSFQTNDIIFTERPLVAIQKANNKMTVLACHHCLTFIGAIAEEYQGQGLMPPFSKKCVGKVEEPLTCPNGCEEAFCSKKCLEDATSVYHKHLCGKNEAVSRFLEHSMNVTYRFELAAKIIAIMIHFQREKKSEDVDPFSKFIRGPWTKISHYDAMTKRFEHQDAMDKGVNFEQMKENILKESLELLKATPLYDKEFDRLFSYEYYNNLIGMIDMNGADIESLPPKETRIELCKIFKCEEDEVPYSAGLGIFTIHSCLNHSCKPNAEVVGGLREVKDTKIKVVALRPIQKGDEITISYIEEPNRRQREDRQKELKGGYQFECCCPKCEQEKE